jgi:hypothetical protein
LTRRLLQLVLLGMWLAGCQAPPQKVRLEPSAVSTASPGSLQGTIPGKLPYNDPASRKIKTH